MRHAAEAQSAVPFEGREPSLASLVYFAGLFDGEGSIDIVNGWSPRIKIHMTSYETMMWLQSQFGGKVYKTGGTRKPAWAWHLLRQADLRALLEGCLPFLIVKRNRANAVLALLRFLAESARSDYQIPEWRTKARWLGERCRARYWDAKEQRTAAKTL